MHAPLVEARKIRFGYSRSVEILHGVSMSVPQGSFCALIGPNGSGKSTLLRLLAGIVTPGGGEIRFEGRPFAAFDRRRLASRVGYVSQTHSTVFPFTALEVVLTGRSPYTPRFRFENETDRDVARRALATVDASNLESRPVTELSAGERQLVAVARVLAQEADCMLLDEPSASLDLKHRASLVGTLRRLRDERGLTTVMVTHDLQLLDPGVDYVFAMRSGEIVTEGSPSAVLRAERLADIYGDPHVRSARLDGRTFVWSEW